MAEKQKNGHYIGFDLGGTKMMASVMDSEFSIVGSKREKFRDRGGQKLGVEQIITLARTALSEAKIPGTQIKGFGIGCPGTMDLDKGIILEAPNLGWKNVTLKKDLEAEFGCPVFVGNDVDVGTYGEYIFGAGKDGRCVLGVFPGTGIGGGCVYDGNLLRGKTGSIMEIGHIQVQRDGPQCGCGRRGCIEAIASRLAIARECAAAAFRGEAPNLYAEAGTEVGKIRSKTLMRSIEAGDTIIEKIVRRAARQLGRAIASAVNLLGPDVVVLGGGLVEAMPKLFLNEIETSIRAEAMTAYTTGLKVVAAVCGDDSVVLGAAALVDRQLKEQK